MKYINSYEILTLIHRSIYTVVFRRRQKVLVNPL